MYAYDPYSTETYQRGPIYPPPPPAYPAYPVSPSYYEYEDQPDAEREAQLYYYPLSQYQPVRMSGRQRAVSVLFIATVLVLITCGVYLFVSTIGFEKMTQLYGFDRVIETYEVEPPPAF